MYFPYAQADGVRGVSLLVKTLRDPRSIVGAVRSQIFQLDPTLPVAQVRPMTEATAQPRRVPVSSLHCSVCFPLSPSPLLQLEFYGVMAYTVAQRTQEFGIRMAIGAGSFDVLWLVLPRNGK